MSLIIASKRAPMICSVGASVGDVLGILQSMAMVMSFKMICSLKFQVFLLQSCESVKPITVD